MASVPSFYIKTKNVDFDGEIFACLGLPTEVAGIRVRPPSFGVFSLLELVDSIFVKNAADATAMDFCRALYIGYKGRECAEEVQGWVVAGGRDKFRLEDEKTWLAFDWAVAEFAKKNRLDEAPVEEMAGFRNFLLANTFAGYEMIPSSSPEDFSPYVFGPSAMAQVVAANGYSAIWDIPLCMVGHMAAAKAKYNGVKGVRRPKDPEDIKLQVRLAEEREAKGELHPWQISEPDQYGVSADQVAARPEIKAEWNALLKCKLREKREARQKKEVAENG